MSELYKKYRPKTLARMVGNENTINALSNMLKRKKLPRTIMFTGPSGCGKTTLARILRKELKCHDLDFKELNCSDFRGIDTIRTIARTMNLAATGGLCRIWLLDEAHQLSKDAQNAALKILEDTPGHVYFFLCTTDPQKLLKTILTRCCEMPVKALTDSEMEKLLKRIVKRESISLSKDVMETLIDASQGSARSALVSLDKISNLDEDAQEEAIKQIQEEQNEGIVLCKVLMGKKTPTWRTVAKILLNLKGEPESTRWAVLGYARSGLLKGWASQHQAYRVICAFENHFYDSKAAGLARACYESIFGD